jgi:alkylation response protein AidB-like acyl-CoA dehydrogenase
VNELAGRSRDILRRGGLRLPLPGEGGTPKRHAMLMQLGREDLSVGRIAEAHTDAIAILAQQGRGGCLEGLYGVWASDGPASRLKATALADGGWCLSGIKQYCSGASFLDAALVTAHAEEGVLLFEVPMHLAAIDVLESTWMSPALADTSTGPVSFNDVVLPATARIGPANWYLQRPGFWHGAIGPAACWAGGALSLIEAAQTLNRKDPHSRAQVGALAAIGWGLRALLDQSGGQIDRDPTDSQGEARKRALMVRHLIERWSTEVLDRFGRATGPQLLALDARVIRQHAALTVYIRQCHAERDLETIAE